MGVTMLFRKYVCVLFYVLSMRPFGIPLRMVEWDLQHPKSNGIRLHLLWQTLRAKLLMLFFLVFLLMNSTGYLMWIPLKRRGPSWDHLRRNQEGQGHQTSNAHYSIWGSEDESFDSFYIRLNEIVIAKLNPREKIKDAKVVRKVLRSLLESFRAKVTAIEESKDLDEIKIQELVGSLQTYELGYPLTSPANHLLSKP